MLTRAMVIDSAQDLGIQCEISDLYGRGSVLKLLLNPIYHIYTAYSSIENCFWNVTENVIRKMENSGIEFGIALIDGYGERIFLYDKIKSRVLLSSASVEEESGNYRLTLSDVSNSITLGTYGEFIDSMI